MFKKLSFHILLPAVAILTFFYACDFNSSDEEITTEPSMESAIAKGTKGPSQVVRDISTYLRIDPNQTLPVDQETSSWLKTQAEYDEATAAKLLPKLDGAKSIAVYTWNNRKRGWDQYLLSLTKDYEISVVVGDLLQPWALEYYVSEDGDHVPVQARKKKPKKEKFGKRSGCRKKSCWGTSCSDTIFIPCKLHKKYKSCTSSSDCQGETDGELGVIDIIQSF